MKMKISLLVAVGTFAGLVGCGVVKHSPWEQPLGGTVPMAINAGSVYESAGEGGSVRVAYLLPLTGSSAAVGDAFRNAAIMAQFDAKNGDNEVFFFDTKGTSVGTKEALKQAADVRPDVILGPVFSQEVAVVKKEGARVPVISFTSDNAVVGGGVYTSALTIPEQVDTMAAYACQEGKLRLAVLGPENKVGELTLNTLQQSIKKCPGMTVAAISLYKPKDVNLAPAVLKVAPKPIDPNKKELTEEETEELAKPIADRVKYDALFVVEEGVKLSQVMSVLSFYDVTPSEVVIMGLSGVQAQAKEKAVRGIYFPGMPIDSIQKFEKTYKENFGKAPIPLASFGYDAFMLSAFLKSKNALTNTGITSVAGFRGVNGLMRFNKDGTNGRLLDIYQVNPYGRPKLIQASLKTFEFLPQEWAWNSEQSIEDVSKDLEEQNLIVEEERAKQIEAQSEVSADVGAIVPMHAGGVGVGIGLNFPIDDIINATEEELGY